MKLLIPIVIGLLVVGCGKKQSTNTNESNNTPENSAKQKVGNEALSKGDDKTTTSEKPTKELTKEDVFGTYQVRLPNGLFTLQLLKDGKADMERVTNAGKKKTRKWYVENCRWKCGRCWGRNNHHES